MNKIYTLLFVSVFSFYFSSAQINQLWGMTSAGGDTSSGGTMFYLTIGDSALHVVHQFDPGTGFQPNGSLIQAANGLLYGLAENGGANGYGVLFGYDPGTNTYSDIFDFDGAAYGGYPTGNLTVVNDTTLYGMTSAGGANDNGDGTIFKFNPTTNILTHLYDFTDSGSVPMGSLIKASDGKLYGLTSGGAINNGTLFSYNPTTGAYDNLYYFTNSNKGVIPDGSLLQAGNGLLYGMASGGGNYGYGVIFSFNIADSVYSDIYNFNDTLGENPFGSLIQASDSLLYGMASGGGAYGVGVIFNFNVKTNAYNDIYDFNGSGGASPYADLLQSGNGTLYGMTDAGGASNVGVIFSFDPSNSNYSDLVDFNDSIGQYPMGNLISINANTGIPALTDNATIQLYPNPTSNELAIKSENVRIGQIDIYNMLGEKVCLSQSAIENINVETIINVGALSEGIYFVHVLFDATNSQTQDSWVGKFVKTGTR